MSHDDFETEPIPGLPALPPSGEKILWQGAPHWQTIARRVMHVDLAAMYVAAILAWKVGSAYMDGLPARDIAVTALTFLAFSSVALGILTLIAWGIGRTTVYTITSRRIALRFGIALPITFNLPFRAITSADMRQHGNGRGDIVLRLSKGTRIAYPTLWPHVRPWRLNAPEPMLRAIPNVDEVASILAEALAADLARKTTDVETSIVAPHVVSMPVKQPALIAAE